MGVIGFMLIENYSFFDALYMTVITITTIGYQEIHPLSTAGRIFNIVLILSSFATFAFALGKSTQYIVEGEMNKYFKTRRLMSTIKHLKNHVIICGYGRNGQQAAATLKQYEIPFVLIESSRELLDTACKKDPSLLYINGNATDDEQLHLAGISNARALLSTLPVDADNVFIVLSARSLNTNLAIISRASENSSYNKLLKAGANNVIMPDKIGGAHMAGLVCRQDVIEFIDYLGGQNEFNVQLSVIDIDSNLSSKSIGQVFTSNRINLVGVKEIDGQYQINPPRDFSLQAGMKVFILADVETLNTLKKELSI